MMTENHALTAQGGPINLRLFLINFWRRLSGILQSVDNPKTNTAQKYLKGFFFWD